MSQFQKSSQDFAGTMESRLAWLMLLRIVIISILLGATVIFSFQDGNIEEASPLFLISIIAVTYLLTIIYALWYRSKTKMLPLAYFQLSMDAVLFGALVYSTGGVSSGFTFLFHLWVIMAAISVEKRGAYIQASASSAVLMLIATLMQVGIIEELSDLEIPALSLTGTLYFLAVNILSLYLVAALVNVLLNRLEKTRFSLKLEIAKKKKLQIELEQAKRLAALGELAATLAHEIRNPLSAVSGSFQLLNQGNNVSDEDNRLIEIINRELSRIARLVEDILEYTRTRTPVFSKIDLLFICREIVELFKNSGNTKNINLKIKSDDNPVCEADSSMIKQAIWNLLSNAASATGNSGSINIDIKKQNEDTIFIQISDSGPGVPEELKNNIFEAFFSTKQRGMGLGLALCKRIVQIHNGELELLENNQTKTTLKGAVFRLTLPIKQRLEII